MATRQRGRRGRGNAPVAPMRATRTTRGAASEDPEADPYAMEIDAQLEGADGVEHNTPIPRRGARPAQSVATIPTDRPEDDSDDGAVVNDGEEDATGEDEASYLAAVEDETKLAVMVDGLPDIVTAADNLWVKLLDPSYSDPQFVAILRRRRAAFLTCRADYDSSHIEPFIDYQRLRLLDERTGGRGSAMTILRKVNLASAVDTIDQIEQDDSLDKHIFLRSLSASFPVLFTDRNDVSSVPELHLQVYTHYLIESLADEEFQGDPTTAIAKVFCVTGLSDELDLPHLFSHGPYQSLGGVDKEAEGAVIADRIQEIVPIVKKDKRGRGVAALRKKYPMDSFLSELRAFMVAAWPTVSPRAFRKEREVFHDAEENLEIDDAMSVSVLDSQQLGRQGFSASQQPLFRLGDNDAAQAQRYDASAAASRAAAETLARVAEDGEDFETDHRAIQNGKRASHPAPATRQPKRQRISDAAAPASQVGPASQGIPPSAQPGSSAPEYMTQQSMYGIQHPATSADYDAIKLRKKAITEAARAARQEAGPQQSRKAWSTEDCNTLLECIMERQGRWAHIQEHDTHKFQHPRNQQAYRDKARNMKVDYLMTDAVLPPCFDGVALGRKEIARLIALGKNPYRKEAEVDADNIPVNTAYIGPPDAVQTAQAAQEAPVPQPPPQPSSQAPQADPQLLAEQQQHQEELARQHFEALQQQEEHAHDEREEQERRLREEARVQMTQEA